MAGRSRAAAASDRFRGVLVGGVVGDALGAVFEGHPGPVPGHSLGRLEATAGSLRYTDDSAMAFALAESLLFCRGLDQDHLMAAFAAGYEAQPDRGYGRGTAALLAGVIAGTPWRRSVAAQFGGQGSRGDGAAMRVAPVALHAPGDVDRVVELARRSAEVTHAHPEAIDGAAVQAAAVAEALSLPMSPGVDRRAFLARVRRVAATDALQCRLDLVGELVGDGSAADVTATLGTDAAAAAAVPAAVCCFLRHPDSFTEAVRFAIGLGGDTDTIAAMAGAIAGARLGASAIPERWVDRTEGTDKAASLADRFRHRLGVEASTPS